MQLDTYWRRAKPIKVVGGNTLDLNVDLGFHLSATLRIRLLGIDTPEMRSSNESEKAQAQLASKAVGDWVQRACIIARAPEHDPSWPLVLRTEKDDSFGRWLASVHNVEGESLNGYLLDQGFAVEWRR